MQTIKELKALPVGTRFAGLVVLRSKTHKTAKNGNPFMTVELSDTSGTIGSTIFGDSPQHPIVSATEDGAVLRVEGSTDSFNDRISLKLSRLEVVPESKLTADEISALVAVAPAGIAAGRVAIMHHVGLIKDARLKTAVSLFFMQNPMFFTSPAATNMHHHYRGGLAEHTASMAAIAVAVCPLYPQVNQDIVLAAVLLHDTGKIEEYKQGMASGKTVMGHLRSHLFTGAVWARKNLELQKVPENIIKHIEHCILSHHGQPEYGAITYPATPEAVLVNKIDDMDAKMGAVQYLLRSTHPEAELSDKSLMLQTALWTGRPDFSANE